MDAATAPPTGALLVRVPLSGPGDLSTLPRVPAPHSVTLTLSHSSLRPSFGSQPLKELGYRLVGTHVSPTRGGTETSQGTDAKGDALILIRAPLLDAQASWARTLMERADKVYDCDLGPVQHVFDQVLTRHLQD